MQLSCFKMSSSQFLAWKSGATESEIWGGGGGGGGGLRPLVPLVPPPMVPIKSNIRSNKGLSEL